MTAGKTATTNATRNKNFSVAELKKLKGVEQLVWGSIKGTDYSMIRFADGTVAFSSNELLGKFVKDKSIQLVFCEFADRPDTYILFESKLVTTATM